MVRRFGLGRAMLAEHAAVESQAEARLSRAAPPNTPSVFASARNMAGRAGFAEVWKNVN